MYRCWAPIATLELLLKPPMGLLWRNTSKMFTHDMPHLYTLFRQKNILLAKLSNKLSLSNKFKHSGFKTHWLKLSPPYPLLYLLQFKITCTNCSPKILSGKLWK